MPGGTPKKVNITLSVSASTLYGYEAPTQTEIENCCSMFDDNDDPTGHGSTIENFTSNVYVNQDVSWSAISDNPGYNIAINSITYEPTGGDINFFDSAIITGSGGRSGNVTAHVRNDVSLNQKLDVYTINFTVFPPGNDNGKTFSIDPKLQANT